MPQTPDPTALGSTLEADLVFTSAHRPMLASIVSTSGQRDRADVLELVFVGTLQEDVLTGAAAHPQQRVAAGLEDRLVDRLEQGGPDTGRPRSG